MNLKHITLLLTFALSIGTAQARDCKNDSTYKVLHSHMTKAFNTGDSTNFFTAVKVLEDYLLQQDDLHLYYTQRCNEIIFLMNAQKIFEAYMKAQELSKELRERGLDKEIYMAINMKGHINRYCGNHEAAKKDFKEVIALMEKHGYYESMPPIYMNIVNVELEDSPEEALEMLNKAAEIAREYAPERVFDIESRRLLSYYNMGDMEHFAEGYKAYKEGIDSGLTTISGRAIDVYYQAYLGNIDQALQLARETIGDDADEIIINLNKNAGRWKEAFEAQRTQMNRHDSINSIILTNNMKGIEDELRLYEIEHKADKEKLIGMILTIAFLILLICALSYIVFIRRLHMKQLKKAYERALESDKMKTAFIRNVSHEVRTPLNIIMVSLNENTGDILNIENVDILVLLQQIVGDFRGLVTNGVELRVENDLPDAFTLSTNKKMIARMVVLLLDNANKNTTTGHIAVKASTEDNNLSIVVEDTGCGIDAKEAEHIFERFVKLDNFKEGLGLGLPLCRMIARRLGGNVILDTSYAGPGARFVITLPL